MSTSLLHFTIWKAKINIIYTIFTNLIFKNATKKNFIITVNNKSSLILVWNNIISVKIFFKLLKKVYNNGEKKNKTVMT